MKLILLEEGFIQITAHVIRTLVNSIKMSHAVFRSKVLVVGTSAVGKSSIIKSFLKDGASFSSTYPMTLSAEVTIKSVINEEHNITVEFFMYDISGSPIYEYEYPDVREPNPLGIRCNKSFNAQRMQFVT